MVEESPASPNAPKSHTNPKSSILIGTSGYDYPEWKGVFYPPEVKRADFLSYYATQFNALELNNTFYNMPTAERLLSFYERSEGRLQFSVKANRLLTHEVTSEWQKTADDFKQALTPLLEKASLSAVLFQFPQNFHYTPDNRIYLANLIEDFEAFPVLIEFRHAGWIRESVFEGLEKRGAGLVYCDMPQLRNLPDGKTVKSPFIGPNAYIRLHGRNAGAWYASSERQNGSARYCYDYSDSELESFVPVISKAMSEGKKTQVFFNNHPDGSGAKNAKRLKDLLAPIP
ncbi:DUF72 domain-containing protein [Treponema ruminis]|uniref:Uncharacterized protein YecE (DUF72 family) n=1 Tax=Treponema ruminis TaxID=744515 RepID=A0A7W8LMR3_9SPIR|nr:DUF72 domain-containing protein [Treponema ruminis]MBB5226846.1 uncharacterized protein YecE (DUF72 family) [Treponema ruminis]QSI01277.1 DUF72 domain-containing protein [Treponema ruminis]